MVDISFENFIQIAGVIDQVEAELLINCGVNYLGFPLRLPVNKEDLTEEEVSKIISNLSPPQYGVIISYSKTADESLELCNKLGAKIIQLHGPISKIEIKKIKDRDPKIVIIKSLVIKKNNESELVKEISEYELFVDAFITDTFDPTTGASGATGKTHEWEISKKFVEISSKPVILAGGLNPNNVYEAIIYVKPAGVDVHTGVESVDGRKDAQLVKEFLNRANLAFNKIAN